MVMLQLAHIIMIMAMKMKELCIYTMAPHRDCQRPRTGARKETSTGHVTDIQSSQPEMLTAMGMVM